MKRLDFQLYLWADGQHLLRRSSDKLGGFPRWSAHGRYSARLLQCRKQVQATLFE
jgi:hypothetical protein